MAEQDKRLDQVYFYWMERTIKAQRKATNKLFKELGIKLTSEQWAILKRLDEQEGSTQRALAESTYKDPASLTRSLDLLEKQNLIERRSADRRSFTIHLTKEGKKLVDRVIPEAIKYRKQGIKGISASDMKIFKKVLDTIYNNFQENLLARLPATVGPERIKHWVDLIIKIFKSETSTILLFTNVFQYHENSGNRWLQIGMVV